MNGLLSPALSSRGGEGVHAAAVPSPPLEERAGGEEAVSPTVWQLVDRRLARPPQAWRMKGEGEMRCSRSVSAFSARSFRYNARDVSDAESACQRNGPTDHSAGLEGRIARFRSFQPHRVQQPRSGHAHPGPSGPASAGRRWALFDPRCERCARLWPQTQRLAPGARRANGNCHARLFRKAAHHHRLEGLNQRSPPRWQL